MNDSFIHDFLLCCFLMFNLVLSCNGLVNEMDF